MWTTCNSNWRWNKKSLHRVILSALPRGKRFRPLVSEYGSYLSVLHAVHVDAPTGVVPAGAKLVHQRITKRGEVRVDDLVVHASAQNFTINDDVMVSQFGMPRDPMDFCDRAVKCGHPRGMAVHLPDSVREVIEQNLSTDPAELALTRCRELT